MSPLGRLLAGGFGAMMIVMGVGRFYYTPLLPIMMRDYGLEPQTASFIASANFAGYLAGSLAMSLVTGRDARLYIFRAALCASVATTFLMGFAASPPAFMALRALSGIASALAMISAAGIIAEALARIGEEARIGWVFGGVGCGIAASGLLVHLAAPSLGADGLWIAAGLAGAGLAPFVLAAVRDRVLPDPGPRDTHLRRVARPLPFWPLFCAYTLEGLGYSVFATFIVAIVKARPGLEAIGDFVWIIAGLAVLPSSLLFAALAERFGFAKALLAAYLAQIVGVVLPVVSQAGPAALAGAVLFGGTFIPITLLSMPLGRHGLGGRGFAVLTAGFGLGQMVGPLLAGLLVTGTGGYDRALLGSALVLVVAASCLGAAMFLRTTQTDAKT